MKLLTRKSKISEGVFVEFNGDFIFHKGSHASGAIIMAKKHGLSLVSRKATKTGYEYEVSENL